MLRRQFIFGVGASLVAAGCGGSPTSPGGVTPPPPPPDPQPPPPPPATVKLRLSRILAFGDSMTEGVMPPSIARYALDAGKPESYPYKLLTLLTTRYSSQTLSVFNAGIGGRNAWEDRSRLQRAINDTSPELVLLMEGANDLNSIAGPSTNAAVDVVVGSMEDMVRDTVGRNIPVLLATLPPQHLPKGHAADLLPRYNNGLKVMAGKKGATIVDVNAQFSESLISSDGLHPSDAGYSRLAEIFLDSIKQQYEFTEAPGLR